MESGNRSTYRADRYLTKWFNDQNRIAMWSEAIKSEDDLITVLKNLYRKAFRGFQYSEDSAEAMAKRAVELTEDYFAHAQAYADDPEAWSERLLKAWQDQPGGAELYAAAGQTAEYACKDEPEYDDPDELHKADGTKLKMLDFGSDVTEIVSAPDIEQCREILKELRETDYSAFFRMGNPIPDLSPENQIRYASILGMLMYTEYKTDPNSEMPYDMTMDSCMIFAAAQVLCAQQAQRKEEQKSFVKGAAFVGVSLAILYLFSVSVKAIYHCLRELYYGTDERQDALADIDSHASELENQDQKQDQGQFQGQIQDQGQAQIQPEDAQQ